MNMNAFQVFVAFVLVAAVSAEKFCYNDIVEACKPSTKEAYTAAENCNSRYGAIAKRELLGDLQIYANNHLNRSYEYLLMSTHYANYEKNRAGFEKLFRDLSETAWRETINLIKYMTKRGGEMNFHNKGDVRTDPGGNYELYELPAIAKALDIEKQLANEGLAIHSKATKKEDASVAHYIEEEFVLRQTETVRTLAGYTTDLRGILSEQDSSLGLYLFDEYLKKQ